MRHFSTSDIVSVVFMREPSEVIRRQSAEALESAIDTGSAFPQGVAAFHIDNFVFDGDRNSASLLAERLTPAEFRMVRNARVWFKELSKQFKYRSSRFWTRTGDFVYVNLNTGRSVVFIDAHYWVE